MDTLGIEPSTPRKRNQMLSGCDNQLHHVPDTDRVRSKLYHALSIKSCDYDNEHEEFTFVVRG